MGGVVLIDDCVVGVRIEVGVVGLIGDCVAGVRIVGEVILMGGALGIIVLGDSVGSDVVVLLDEAVKTSPI